MSRVKLSAYNIFKTGSSHAVVFNSYSGVIAKMTLQEYEKLMSLESIQANDTELLKWKEQGLIVDGNVNESDLVSFSRYRNTFTKDTATYRILTTTGCNAKCFYCYEEGYQKIMMDENTAESVVQFIVNNAQGRRKITLNWFGGEPLLNPLAISIISHGVREKLRDLNIKVVGSIITNASLFNEELIKKAKTDWSIKNVQITLDGLREEHERRKNYNNYPDAFEKTLNTIEELLKEGIFVSTRLNYDKNNHQDIIELISLLKSRFGNAPNYHCYTYPLFDKPDECTSYSINGELLKDYHLPLLDVLKRNGYYKPNLGGARRSTACFATDPNSFVINADGFLYKCPMDMADRSRSIGTVYEPIALSNVFAEWCTPTLPSKCNECVLLPVCQGGCRAARILNYNDNYCRLKFLSVDYALNELINNENL